MNRQMNKSMTTLTNWKNIEPMFMSVPFIMMVLLSLFLAVATTKTDGMRQFAISNGPFYGVIGFISFRILNSIPFLAGLAYFGVASIIAMGCFASSDFMFISLEIMFLRSFAFFTLAIAFAGSLELVGLCVTVAIGLAFLALTVTFLGGLVSLFSFFGLTIPLLVILIFFALLVVIAGGFSLLTVAITFLSGLALSTLLIKFLTFFAMSVMPVFCARVFMKLRKQSNLLALGTMFRYDCLRHNFLFLRKLCLEPIVGHVPIVGSIYYTRT